MGTTQRPGFPVPMAIVQARSSIPGPSARKDDSAPPAGAASAGSPDAGQPGDRRGRNLRGRAFLRRLPDHSVLGDRRRVREADAEARRRLPADGRRDGVDRRGHRRVACRRQGADRDQRPRLLADAGEPRPGGHGRSALRGRRRAARGPEHRLGHQAGAVRHHAGALGTPATSRSSRCARRA